MDNKAMELVAQCEKKAQMWLTPAFDEETQQQIKDMLAAEDKTNLI